MGGRLPAHHDFVEDEPVGLGLGDAEAEGGGAGEEEAGVLEVVLQQDRVVTAFVPTVVQRQLINWGPPVMSRIAQSVAPP